jgi:steroid delta-isomerase-like uncharacterized protein
MSDSTDIVARWAAAWSSGDITRVAELFVEDCVYEDVTLGVVNRGTAELEAFGQAFFAAAPDLQIELASHIVSGDHGAAEWWFKGTQHGEVIGLPPSGRRFAFRGMSAFDLRDGKIVRCSDYWDLETFRSQISPSA